MAEAKREAVRVELVGVVVAGGESVNVELVCVLLVGGDVAVEAFVGICVLEEDDEIVVERDLVETCRLE